MPVYLFVCTETFLKAELCPVGKRALAGAVIWDTLMQTHKHARAQGHSGSWHHLFVLNSLHSLNAFCYFPFSFYPFSFLFCTPLWSLLFLLPLFLFLPEPDSLIDRVTYMCRRTKPAGSIQTRLLTIWRKGACSFLGTWHVASKMCGINPQLHMHTCKWLSKLSAFP